MAQNVSPIYTLVPNTGANTSTLMASTMLTAVGDYTGISANYVLVHTAGTNGSYVRRLRFKAIGTNTASVARIFINNGATPGTGTNNTFYGEISLPGTTATNIASTVDIDYPMEFALDPSFRIYVGLATTVSAGWVCAAIAGQY
jgi:hypothetical protein